jgi:ABC-type sugar transport system substrate-binding protein
MRTTVDVSVLAARATEAKARNRNAIVFFINPSLKLPWWEAESDG